MLAAARGAFLMARPHHTLASSRRRSRPAGELPLPLARHFPNHEAQGAWAGPRLGVRGSLRKRAVERGVSVGRAPGWGCGGPVGRGGLGGARDQVRERFGVASVTLGR